MRFLGCFWGCFVEVFFSWLPKSERGTAEDTEVRGERQTQRAQRTLRGAKETLHKFCDLGLIV